MEFGRETPIDTLLQHAQLVSLELAHSVKISNYDIIIRSLDTIFRLCGGADYNNCPLEGPKLVAAARFCGHRSGAAFGSCISLVKLKSGT